MNIISLSGLFPQRIVFLDIFHYILVTGLKYEGFKLGGHPKELSFLWVISN